MKDRSGVGYPVVMWVLGIKLLLSGRADLNWEMSGEMTQLVKTRSLTLSPGTYVLGEDGLLQTAL